MGESRRRSPAGSASASGSFSAKLTFYPVKELDQGRSPQPRNHFLVDRKRAKRLRCAKVLENRWNINGNEGDGVMTFACRRYFLVKTEWEVDCANTFPVISACNREAER